MSDTKNTPKVSQTFGAYEILERLGEGGMCHVFRARHVELGHECALKLLKESARKDERMRELFVTEADVALLLHHANLISTYDAGEFGGRYYIAMELIEGATLDQLLARCKELGLKLPIDLSLFVLAEILEGLHALHNATSKTGRPLGLVHRDVTPHNIFLSFDGRVVLGDFGVAHIQAYGDLPKDGMLGKIGYLAPELILQEEFDRRVDIFSAGVVLYELVTGTDLYGHGTDEEIMNRIVHEEVVRPKKLNPDVPKNLEAALLKALAKRPRERHASAEELLWDLDRCRSKMLGNPYALSALLAALYRIASTRWKEKGRAPSGFHPVTSGRKPD